MQHPTTFRPYLPIHRYRSGDRNLVRNGAHARGRNSVHMRTNILYRKTDSSNERWIVYPPCVVRHLKDDEPHPPNHTMASWNNKGSNTRLPVYRACVVRHLQDVERYDGELEHNPDPHHPRWRPTTQNEWKRRCSAFSTRFGSSVATLADAGRDFVSACLHIAHQFADDEQRRSDKLSIARWNYPSFVKVNCWRMRNVLRTPSCRRR